MSAGLRPMRRRGREIKSLGGISAAPTPENNKGYLLLMYIVTSKPKRMSLYSGVSHFMMTSSS